MQILARKPETAKQEHAFLLPDSSEFRIHVIHVTPEIAQEWLRRNHSNRAIRPINLRKYKSSMERGEWRDTGETVKFSRTGRLLDGQHRLLAICETGVKLRLCVATGIADEAFDSLDAGASRTAPDMLTVLGWDGWEARTGGTAAYMALNVAAGRPAWSTEKASNRAVVTFVLDQPQFKATIEFMAKLPRPHPVMPHARGAWLHWEFSRLSPELADSFIEGLYVGDGLRRGSPLLLLRKQLLDDQIRGEIRPLRDQLHAAVKAWNSTRTAKEVKSSRSLFPRSDEPFPSIV